MRTGIQGQYLQSDAAHSPKQGRPADPTRHLVQVSLAFLLHGAGGFCLPGWVISRIPLRLRKGRLLEACCDAASSSFATTACVAEACNARDVPVGFPVFAGTHGLFLLVLDYGHEICCLCRRLLEHLKKQGCKTFFRSGRAPWCLLSARQVEALPAGWTLSSPACIKKARRAGSLLPRLACSSVEITFSRPSS